MNKNGIIGQIASLMKRIGVTPGHSSLFTLKSNVRDMHSLHGQWSLKLFLECAYEFQIIKLTFYM
jgi:hypothetical protein